MVCYWYLTSIVGTFGHANGNVHGHVADARQRRIQRSALNIAGLHEVGQLLGGDEEHFVGYVVSTRADHAQANAWEDVGIVALARVEGLVTDLDRWEGRARREDHASLCISIISLVGHYNIQ